MSKHNKVNPGQYTQAGRLSQDDAARERASGGGPVASERTGSGQKAAGTAPKSPEKEARASQGPGEHTASGEAADEPESDR